MVFNLGEKKGGVRKLERDSMAFQSTINELKLVEIPTKNAKFTWNNKHGGEKQIASRLDHFLLSEEIYLTSWEIEARILPQVGLDHWPISLSIHITIGPRNKPFRFETLWLDHPKFMDNMK